MSSPLKFPTPNLDNPKVRVYLKIYPSTERLLSNENTDPVSTSAIYLPLPKGILEDSLLMSYSENNEFEMLKAMGNLIVDGGESGDITFTPTEGSVDGILQKVKQAGENFKNNANYDNIMSVLWSKFEKETVDVFGEEAQAGLQALGYTRRPNKTVMFDSVNLKVFTLSWDLYPESETEAITIENIIERVLLWSLPSCSDDLKYGEDGNLI